MTTAAVMSMSGDEWDAHAEITAGLAIRRFMAAHPAPADSRVAVDLAEWAENLMLDGQARLRERAARPLRLLD